LAHAEGGVSAEAVKLGECEPGECIAKLAEEDDRSALSFEWDEMAGFPRCAFATWPGHELVVDFAQPREAFTGHVARNVGGIVDGSFGCGGMISQGVLELRE
jgi:hypothetical protein